MSASLPLDSDPEILGAPNVRADSLTSSTTTTVTDLTVGVTGCARILRQSRATFLSNRTRAPWRVPPACTPPGSHRPVWIIGDVLDWLRQHQEQPVAPPATHRRRGRPTKTEQASRAAQEARRG